MDFIEELSLFSNNKANNSKCTTDKKYSKEKKVINA